MLIVVKVEAMDATAPGSVVCGMVLHVCVHVVHTTVLSVYYDVNTNHFERAIMIRYC